MKFLISKVTSKLGECHVNIAYLRVFREEKGGLAYTIVESDVDDYAFTDATGKAEYGSALDEFDYEKL